MPFPRGDAQLERRQHRRHRRRRPVFCIYSPSNDDSKRSDPSALWSSVAIDAQIPPDKRIEMVPLENFGSSEKDLDWGSFGSLRLKQCSSW